MNKAYQIQQRRGENLSPGTPEPDGASDGSRGPDAAERHRAFITRWRQALLRTEAVPAALKRMLPELSDYELAIYLAVKCRFSVSRKRLPG